MATLTLHPGERRKAFWTIEDTSASDALEVSVAGGPFVPLQWNGEESWFAWVQASPSAEADTITLHRGLSSALVRLITGEVVLHDAGAFNVLSGCEWPVDWGSCGVEPPEDVDERERAENLAASTLRALTLGRVGGCPITVRPCARACWESLPVRFSGRSFFPHVGVNGRWVNSCGCGNRCHCGGAIDELVLAMPVGRVDEVWVDGGMLDPSAYRVDNGDRLVRTDGGRWPACQDMSQDDHGPDAFSVTYLNAYPVDATGAYAAGWLAAEYAKACAGRACSLPDGVISVVRQGVTYEIARDLFSEGLTGNQAVDAYTARFNPHRLRTKPTVWSPDLVPPRQTTWRSH